jgi:DNA mismatch repair protein MutL
MISAARVSTTTDGTVASPNSHSSLRIRALPGVLSNQIAAGEVIERPASVVKELLENSLDAGSTRIDIDVESGGVALVRVRDNGTGVHREDLALALSRHATSKIQTLADLEGVLSLGFRGEALPSIAAVSRLSLLSRVADSEEAWEIVSAGGVAGEPQPAAGSPGTAVAVRDLFFNTPARRKFLRTERTEFRHVEDAVKRLALSRADVAIRFRHNGREIFMLRAADDAQGRAGRIARLCGAAFAEGALLVELEGPDMKLSGWLGAPAVARAHTDLQYFFINGRMVRDSTARHAVRQAFDERIPQGRHPAYVLYLQMDPSQVDVNVHPAKHEVRFREARLVHDFIWRSLARAFEGSMVAPAVLDAVGDEPREAGDSGASPAPAGRFSGLDEARVADTLVSYGALYGTAIAGSARFPRGERPPGDRQAQTDKPPGTLVAGRYAIATGADGIDIVDLVEARRVLLLHLLDQAAADGEVASRPLLLPESMTVEEATADAMERGAAALGRAGFDLRRTAPASVAVHGVPAPCAHVPALDLTRAAGLWVRESANPPLRSLFESLARLGGERLDDILASADGVDSLLRALEPHAAALSEARAWLRLDASGLEGLLGQWRR